MVRTMFGSCALPWGGVDCVPAMVSTGLGPVEVLDVSGDAAALRGAPRPPSTPPILALHGGMGGWDQSLLLVQALLGEAFCREQGLRVLAVSRPGYLGTPLAVGNSPAAQGDLLAALLEAVGLQRVVVVAVSAGGPTALEFARRYPARCAGLVLASPCTGRLDMPAHVRSRLPLLRALVQLPGIPALMRRAAGREPARAARRSIRDAALAARTLADPEAGPLLQALQRGVFWQMRRRLPGTMHETRLFAAMADIPAVDVAAPLLVAHGTADAIVPFAHGRRVAEDAPQGRLLAIEGGEHVALFTHLHRVRGAAQQAVLEMIA